MSRTVVPLLALLIAVPASAQEWQVARDQFAFAGSRLTIRVEAESAGSLRLIRGASGSVQVAGRAHRGFVAAGLSSDEELTLSSVGPGPVDYLVSVPEDVWISVRLPGRYSGESVGGRTRSRTFEWTRAAPAPDPVPEWRPELDRNDDVGAGPLYTLLSRPAAPAQIDLPDLSTVRSVSVRIEGSLFRVSTSRPLSIEEGSADRFVIRSAEPPMEVVITLPAATRRFQLRAGGATALVVDGASVTTLCEPVTDQWLSDGRRWVTFNPQDGSLRCDTDAIRRHEG
jgi:hypothetical protein